MRKSVTVAPQNPRSYEGVPSDDFYEDSGEENEQMSAGSFQLLQNAPTSIGGHFAFKSEKKWYEDVEEMPAPAYFTLNVHFLNLAIDTIPFYKRLEGSNIPFNKEEIDRMDSSANFSEKDFNKKFSSIRTPPKSTPPSAVPTVVTPSVPFNPRGDELDELLNMTSTMSLEEYLSEKNPIVPKAEPIAVTPEPSPNPDRANADLQEWLDNICEDDDD